MRGAIDNGLPGIDAECGGCLSCATCHVYVEEKFLGLLEPAGKDEQDMLEFVAAERRPGSRLSCQIAVTAKLEGLTVRMPDRQSDL